MSKICRTCLQKTNRTFRASQSLGNFGEGSMRISVVLRFCIPELYLGLSSHPEICFTCKENLKVAYLFKKKCLDTENKIGNFLKNVRCTGKSIDLHDVLSYLNDEMKKKMTLLQEVPPNDTVIMQNAFVNWDPLESETINNNDNLQVMEVRESAPNPMCNGKVINFSDCQNVIVNQYKLSNVINSANRDQDSPQAAADLLTSLAVMHKTLDCEDNALQDDSLCKISNVFSLNSNLEDTINGGFDSIDDQNTFENIMEIKDEPLDFNMNEGFNSIPTDEDTLDASETASYNNRCSSPSLQQFINSIPEVSHPDQYVDVPDFVTINNFGFKELEELRLQQQITEQATLDVNAPEVIPNPISSEKNDKPVMEMRPEMKVVKVLSNAPDVIILNGKRMVKRGNKYIVAEEQPPVNKEQVAPPNIQVHNLSTSIKKRNRRKIKIVPVNIQPAEKKMKLDNTSPVINFKLPKVEVKDVVVLFTNYTNDGDYVNDHDYLISPYKRNKVLIEEGSQWLCMCYICNTRHEVYDHVKHMSKHGALCMVCSSDLGTPYMLNIHYKAHKKPCRYCTQILPYSQIKSHEEKHIAEEEEIVEDSKKRLHSMRKGRRKVKKDEKPVYFPIPKHDLNDLEKSDGSQSEDPLKTSFAEDKNEVEVNSGEEFNNSKRRKKDASKSKMNEEVVSEMIARPRTLRTRVKRWYVESEDEDEYVKDEGSCSTKGTCSDLKGDEK